MEQPTRLLATGWISAWVAAIAVQILAPPITAWVVSMRLGVTWRYFGYGALIFLAFQMLTRVPLVQIGQVLLQDQIAASDAVAWGWIVLLAYSAGLFEEVGRWVGYRWLFQPSQRTWRPGIMYGLGHGGLESMLLIGGFGLLNLLGMLSIDGTDALAQLPAEQREVVQAQLASLAAQPRWYPLLGAWERLSTLGLHVGLSLLVLQTFQRQSRWWLLGAILLHGTVNLTAIALLRAVGPSPEGAAGVEVAIMAMSAIVLVAALYYRGPNTATLPEAAAPPSQERRRKGKGKRRR